MRTFWSNNRPLLIALAIYWLLTGAMVGVAVWLAGGELAYARDDTYIHMAVARSLAKHGVWGTTRHAFASASSSILWPLLLAGVYFLFGVADFWPLLLNLLAGSAILIVAAHEAAPLLVERPYRLTGYLLTVLLLAPLPALSLVAMEHLLHVLLALLFVTMVARRLGDNRPVDPPLLLIALLLVATRYESAVLILAGTALYALRRRPLSGLLLLAIGALPVVAFGLYAQSQGGLFIPNSILVNANQPQQDGLLGIYMFFRGWFFRPASAFLLLVMHLAILPAIFRGGRLTSLAEEPQRVLAVLFLVGTLGHASFGDLAQLAAQRSGYTAQRYDAYLLIIGLQATLANWPQVIRDWRPRPLSPTGRLAVLAALLLLLPPFYERAVESVLRTPVAAKNIYEQQVQMGRFLAAHYNEATIVANDIGAITYYSDIDLIDFIGLGSDDVARLVLADDLRPATLTSITTARQAQIAIVYDDWLRNSLGKTPDDWTLVGRWAIRLNVIAARDIVSFYALSPAEVAPLRTHLEAFHTELPPDVIYGINPRLDETP